MKKIIRYLIKRMCKIFLDDCYIIITCSKKIDAARQPFTWHAITNLANISDARIVSGYAFAKLQTNAEQESAIKEVVNILTVKK